MIRKNLLTIMLLKGGKNVQQHTNGTPTQRVESWDFLHTVVEF